MALEYCEVCGVMLDGSTPSHPIQDAVICAACFTSRRTELVSDQGSVPAGPVQFNCCYCQSLLRLKPVTKRTRVRCPTCNDTFYLHGDGRVEAKLEGSRTAVLEQNTLPPLQPNPPAPDAGKTQPIKRPDYPSQSSADQEALLSDLTPKRLDFLDDLPASTQAPVDTGAFANVVDQGSGLDLLPEDVGPGQAEDYKEHAPGLLREGEIDLEPEALRDRVARGDDDDGWDEEDDEGDDEGGDEGPRAPRRRRGRGKRRARVGGGGGGRRRRRPPPRRGAPGEAEGMSRKERLRERERQEREREIKLEAAEARGQIKQAEAERKALVTGLWFALWLVPLVLSLGAAAMAARDQGLASRGAVGDLLLSCGEAANTSVESLHDMFFPE